MVDDERLHLRFSKEQIALWSGRYEFGADEEIQRAIGPRVKAAGYFTKDDFLKVCEWKTPRTQTHCRKNAPEFIRETTRTALATPSERLRVEVLTLLDGVRWATASVLLHFGHVDPYPIMDYRALWSLSITKRPYPYDFAFWWGYTQFCRELAEECGVTIRVVDRALWQFSKENQPGE